MRTAKKNVGLLVGAWINGGKYNIISLYLI
jgi:hypothetical protein